MSSKVVIVPAVNFTDFSTVLTAEGVTHSVDEKRENDFVVTISGTDNQIFSAESLIFKLNDDFFRFRTQTNKIAEFGALARENSLEIVARPFRVLGFGRVVLHTVSVSGQKQDIENFKKSFTKI